MSTNARPSVEELEDREPQMVNALRRLLGPAIAAWVVEDFEVEPGWWKTSRLGTCLEAALEYAAKGWHVLPLHTVVAVACTCSKRALCRSAGKHPRIETGEEHEAASVDTSVIRAWWRRWPTSNIGIVTGTRSGLVVVDVDPAKGGLISLEKFTAGGAFPKTPTVVTPSGGFHFYFKHPGGKVPCRVGLLPGIDIRGDGGLVVAPPSRHVRGVYGWPKA